ncbi:CAP domain-containing protein [Methylobacterium durans]|uniref:CAP domain-containing protein n=1 Tax=Methylobacterium durans TaxID=2202825 RepID=UPI002B001F1E|nr:CAP domain-containing protein [Methylobacterium durans]MEA1830800.1 CAP domain-containing protein [Methylobacterium durans]
MAGWRFIGSAAAVIGALGLAGCAGEPQATSALPSLYWPLTTNTAQLDTNAAREMISAYRRGRGEAPLTLDPELQRLAETEAAAMAAADRPSKAQTVKVAVERLGYQKANANLSAGYHTLAEAFSGWRDSPSHNAVMLDASATRMGIATAYAPNSKYKVYWALLVAK